MIEAKEKYGKLSSQTDDFISEIRDLKLSC
jgi:hypothetical protein